MRDYASIEAAKQRRLNKETASRIYNLPPGYIKGFKLSLENNQLKVGKGILSHRGNRMEKTTDYILNWEDYLGTVVVRNCTYYIYLCDDGSYKIDVIAPVYNDIHYGWYHTYFANYYYLGRFYFTTGGQYQYLVSGDAINLYDVPTGSLTTDRMYADFLQSLFLQADQVVIGYHTNGTGTYGSPEEGDTMMYLSGNTILRAERISGSWIAKMVLGTLTAGAFAAVLAACTLCHPANPPSSYEALPNPNFRVFNFENNVEDQFGIDDWDPKVQIDYDTTIKKYGTCSLWANNTFFSYMWSGKNGTVGNSQSAATWIYCDVTNGEVDDVNGLLIISLADAGDNNVIDLYLIKEASSNILKFRIQIIKSDVYELQYTIPMTVIHNEWHYVGFVYNSSSDIIKIIFNDTIIYTSDVIGGTWGTGNIYIRLSAARNFVSTHSVYNVHLDEVLCYFDKYLDPNLLAAHYTHGLAWNTEYSADDIYIRPNTEGRVITDNPIRSNTGYQNSLGEYNYAWHRVADPTPGAAWPFIKTSWSGTNDFDSHGWTLDYSSYVTPGTKAIRVTIYQTGSNDGWYWRPYGDTNISNTPASSPTELTQLVAITGDAILQIVIYLSSDYKFEITAANAAIDLYVSAPIEELR
jgi:hypothetical protein